MRQYTVEQRKLYADHICDMVREWIERRGSDFAVELERGVEWCPDVRTGDQRPRANQTLTLTLKVNGGAQETDGLPIVPMPTLFRG